MADADVFASDYNLTYVSDEQPGLRRIKTASSFRYVDAYGEPVHDEKVLMRIKRLAIPPAWTDVWICPKANGHIQATGRDARHRKQYRYHPAWRELRDKDKYQHTIAFAQKLPKIRERVEQDLSKPGLTRDKVLAAVVRLLETTRIRVGNEEYARSNRSFGLTTLRNRHVKVSGTSMRFEFKGKSGVRHSVTLRSRKLANLVRQCQEIEGQELFQYVDGEGERHSVTSADVNAYLREASGDDFTAKDFRTWSGTVLAANALGELGPVEPNTLGAKHNVVKAIETVAAALGNTPSVCRKCYVHPDVIETYMDGSLGEAMERAARRKPRAGLSQEESAVLNLLRGERAASRRNREGSAGRKKT
jgi:DNA topoisomerase-1